MLSGEMSRCRSAHQQHAQWALVTDYSSVRSQASGGVRVLLACLPRRHAANFSSA